MTSPVLDRTRLGEAEDGWTPKYCSVRCEDFTHRSCDTYIAKIADVSLPVEAT